MYLKLYFTYFCYIINCIFVHVIFILPQLRSLFVYRSLSICYIICLCGSVVRRNNEADDGRLSRSVKLLRVRRCGGYSSVTDTLHTLRVAAFQFNR